MSVQFSRPASLEEAFEELQDDDVHLLAGGVSLVLLMNLGLLRPRKLVSLTGLPELQGAVVTDGWIDIGALTTHDELANWPVLQSGIPAAAEMFSRIGNIRVRCAGTLGGNLVHADPAQDPAVMLTVLDAHAIIQSPDGQRTIAVEDLADGPLSTSLREHEILTRIRLPVPAEEVRCSYMKFLAGTKDDYATVSVGCHLSLDKAGQVTDARLAAGAVGGTVVNLDAAAQLLTGEAPDDEDVLAGVEHAVRDMVTPADDRRGHADYKRAMAGAIAKRAIKAAAIS